MSDPYQILGVKPSATDAELRAAYRRLVQLHHPDHNGGSPESAERFEAVQEAWAEARRLRQGAGPTGAAARGAPDGDPAGRAGAAPQSAAAGGRATGSQSAPNLDARLAEMERELQAALAARERAAREARAAQEQTLRDVREMAGAPTGERPTDEELGYFSTDDSFTKIIDDAAAELSQRFAQTRRSPAAHRVSDLIDELADKLSGEPPKRR